MTITRSSLLLASCSRSSFSACSMERDRAFRLLGLFRTMLLQKAVTYRRLAQAKQTNRKRANFQNDWWTPHAPSVHTETPRGSALRPQPLTLPPRVPAVRAAPMPTHPLSEPPIFSRFRLSAAHRTPSACRLRVSFSGGAALLLLRAAATGPARHRLSLHSLAAAAISLPGSLLTPSPAPARPGVQPRRAEGGLVAGGKPAPVAYPSGKPLDPARGEPPQPAGLGLAWPGLLVKKEWNVWQECVSPEPQKREMCPALGFHPAGRLWAAQEGMSSVPSWSVRGQSKTLRTFPRRPHPFCSPAKKKTRFPQCVDSEMNKKGEKKKEMWEIKNK